MSTEIPVSSNEVSGTTMRKEKKKKKKVRQNGEVDDEFIADFDDGNGQMQSKKSKKKSTKAQSARSAGSAIANKSDIPTKKKKKKKKTSQIDDDDVNQRNDDGSVDNFNEQSSNYDNVARKKDRNKMRPPHKRNDINGNVYRRDEYEEQPLPYSSSTIESGTMSRRYNDRGRNNGHPPSMHMESHDENGFTEYDNGDYMSEMGNLDPVDGYNQDYDMSEEDEEEPRFKYSTADLDDGDCRNTRCCLIAAGAFFVFIAILVSIFMAKIMNKDDRRRFLNSIRNLRGSI